MGDSQTVLILLEMAIFWGFSLPMLRVRFLANEGLIQKSGCESELHFVRTLSWYSWFGPGPSVGTCHLKSVDGAGRFQTPRMRLSPLPIDAGYRLAGRGVDQEDPTGSSLPTASLQARARDAAKPGCGDLNVGAASRTRNGSFFLGAGEVGSGREFILQKFNLQKYISKTISKLKFLKTINYF